jgi:hypothetical protein
MKVLPGRKAINQKEATALVFQVARVDGMNADIIDMFAWTADADKTGNEAEKSIGTAIRNRYGGKATWRTERWFIPIPELHYEGRDIPQVIIEVKVYLIAIADVRTKQDSHSITLVGAIGKPEKLAIPMVFLHAILERDLGRFAVVARDAGFTTWEIPGAKSIRLPNDFVNELTERLKWESVVAWLEEFGTQGRCMAALVAGSLFGLAFKDSTEPVPTSKQGWTTEELVSALEGMAFLHGEAREMVSRATPRLTADITLEEAIRLTLQTGKGGD